MTFIEFPGLVAWGRDLKEMSDSALQMVIASLERLLKDGTITFPQYQAGMDQALERALAAESSSSPQREVEHSLGGVKTQQEVPVKDVSSSSSTGVFKSQVVDEDEWCVCGIVESGPESCAGL